jgi:hypothetical protein
MRDSFKLLYCPLAIALRWEMDGMPPNAGLAHLLIDQPTAADTPKKSGTAPGLWSASRPRPGS